MRVKKKTQGRSEFPKRIEALRKARGWTQAKLAKEIGVASSAVGLWEQGRNRPSVEACLRLANIADYPEDKWFLEKAGIDFVKLRAIGGRLFEDFAVPPAGGEAVRVQQVKLTDKSYEPQGGVVLLPSELVTHPGQTVCYTIGGTLAGGLFGTGDLLLVDQHDAGSQDLQPFWDQMVLLRLVPAKGEPIAGMYWSWTYEGLAVAILKLRRDVEPYGRAPAGLEGQVLRPHLGPETASWYAELFKVTGRQSVFRPLPLPTSEWTQTVQKGASEKEAEEEARKRVRLPEGMRILGRVIGWFRAKEAGKR